MIKIGVTGGIGSGKSTVCRIFGTLGVPVYYSDTKARVLMENDPDVIGEVENIFGRHIYLDSSDGRMLDRMAVARRVFNEPGLLGRLNAAVHPAVEKDFDRWAVRQDSHYVIQEAAVLFESGAYKKMDRTVAVSAPEELRIRRVMKRDGVDEATVRARMANQLGEEERTLRADYVILADDMHLVIPQVLELHEIFMKL